MYLSSDEQLKGNVAVWLPLLVVADHTRGLVQISQSTRQLSREWTASGCVMNNSNNGRLRKLAIDGDVSFEDRRCQAKHGELKVCMLRR
jgi:hypothetical protein